MEKAISIVAVTFLFATIICIACITPSQKVENAKKKVLELKKDGFNAKSDVNQAIHDSDAEYQKFKTKQDNRIIALEKSIVELQAKYATNSKEKKPFYVTKLSVLEQRNSELKVKMAGNKATE